MKQAQRIQEVFKAALLAISVAWTGEAAAQIHGPIVDFSDATVAGLGCDSNSISVGEMTDLHGRTVLIVSFDRLNASIYRRALADRSACAIRAKMHIPAGVKLTVESLHVDGFFYAAAPVRAGASAIVSVLGNNLQPLQRSFDSDSDIEDFSIDSKTPLIVRASSQDQNGLFGITTAVSAQSLSSYINSADACISIDQIQIAYRLESAR